MEDRLEALEARVVALEKRLLAFQVAQLEGQVYPAWDRIGELNALHREADEHNHTKEGGRRP
jgi:hypothetical protein